MHVSMLDICCTWKGVGVGASSGGACLDVVLYIEVQSSGKVFGK